MPPNRKTIALGDNRLLIQVTDDGSRTLIDRVDHTAYHSGSGAVAETRHVYLENSGVRDRLTQQRPTSVLEIGFGTGLAMLLAIDAAIQGGTPICYVAVENRWVSHEIFSQLEYHQWLSDPTLATDYARWRESVGTNPTIGPHVWKPRSDQTLTVMHDDALRFDFGHDAIYDAIFFDPFDPDANPELWTAGFLKKMHAVLKEESRLVTYCVSRKVREALASAGFDVQRVRGPKGGKREVAVARKRLG